jgi:hypothetical protein
MTDEFYPSAPMQWCVSAVLFSLWLLASANPSLLEANAPTSPATADMGYSLHVIDE